MHDNFQQILLDHTLREKEKKGGEEHEEKNKQTIKEVRCTRILIREERTCG
jgi:hypothetical protein